MANPRQRKSLSTLRQKLRPLRFGKTVRNLKAKTDTPQGKKLISFQLQTQKKVPAL